MFSKAPNYRQTIHLYIGFALFEFHQGMDYNSINDEIDKRTIEDMMKTFDLWSPFMIKIVHSCTTLKVPLNIIDYREFETVMKFTDDEELDRIVSDIILTEVNEVFQHVKHIKLGDFILHGQTSFMSKYRQLFTHILTNA